MNKVKYPKQFDDLNRNEDRLSVFSCDNSIDINEYCIQTDNHKKISVNILEGWESKHSFKFASPTIGINLLNHKRDENFNYSKNKSNDPKQNGKVDYKRADTGKPDTAKTQAFTKPESSLSQRHSENQKLLDRVPTNMNSTANYYLLNDKNEILAKPKAPRPILTVSFQYK